jgi:hypothetical protein
MNATTAGSIAARLDRLSSARQVGLLLTLVSLGHCFEVHDLFLTAYIAPGLAKAGMFTAASLGPFSVPAQFGVAGIGTFVFALSPACSSAPSSLATCPIATGSGTPSLTHCCGSPPAP